MINLLPPQIKTQLKYSKLNRQLIYYVWVLVALIGLIIVMFGITLFLIRREIGITKEKLAAQEQSIKAYGDIEKEAKDLADRLKAISNVQKNQNHFSEVMSEIATLTPADVSIINLQIDSEKNTANLTAESSNYASAAGLRNLLAKSQRFANVDIDELKKPADLYEIKLSIGLKSGSTK